MVQGKGWWCGISLSSYAGPIPPTSLSTAPNNFSQRQYPLGDLHDVKSQILTPIDIVGHGAAYNCIWFLNRIVILCVGLFCLHVCLCTMCSMQCPRRPGEGVIHPWNCSYRQFSVVMSPLKDSYLLSHLSRPLLSYPHLHNFPDNNAHAVNSPDQQIPAVRSQCGR